MIPIFLILFVSMISLTFAQPLIIEKNIGQYYFAQTMDKTSNCTVFSYMKEEYDNDNSLWCEGSVLGYYSNKNSETVSVRIDKYFNEIKSTEFISYINKDCPPTQCTTSEKIISGNKVFSRSLDYIPDPVITQTIWYSEDSMINVAIENPSESSNEVIVAYLEKYPSSLSSPNSNGGDISTAGSQNISNGFEGDVVLKKALENIGIDKCSEENNCRMEKVDNELIFTTQKTAKLFGIFKVNMQIKNRVNSQTGKIIKTNKPWWGFLATEPEV